MRFRGIRSRGTTAKGSSTAWRLQTSMVTGGPTLWRRDRTPQMESGSAHRQCRGGNWLIKSPGHPAGDPSPRTLRILATGLPLRCRSESRPQCAASLYTSGWECAYTFVIHENDAFRGDCAFRHLKCHRRDRAVGKQSFITAQRYRNYHQPEPIDQIMLEVFEAGGLWTECRGVSSLACPAERESAPHLRS